LPYLTMAPTLMLHRDGRRRLICRVRQIVVFGTLRNALPKCDCWRGFEDAFREGFWNKPSARSIRVIKPGSAPASAGECYAVTRRDLLPSARRESAKSGHRRTKRSVWAWFASHVRNCPGSACGSPRRAWLTQDRGGRDEARRHVAGLRRRDGRDGAGMRAQGGADGQKIRSPRRACANGLRGKDTRKT
jgi:hypothetical protein